MTEMVKIPVDECPAESHMDAAIAVILGYMVKWFDGQPFIQVPIQYIGTSDISIEDDWRKRYDYQAILPYSTDIAAAWEMEDSLEEEWWADYVMALFNLVTEDLGAPDFYSFKKLVYWRMAHASPLDRSRAFLKANRVEYVEVPWKGGHYAAGEGILVDRA